MGRPSTGSRTWHLHGGEGAALAGGRDAVVWWKSSYTGDGEGNCCEIAVSSGQVRVRDSKCPESAMLSFAPASWRSALPMFLTSYGAEQDHG
ncbi:DUF397 domain-containing protein [Streptomyces sp. NPDC047072]|uniref:DUF397 domain-containing protein n=1 Tax=Streptomyces sp. NPDC047072 TaxID=3154809 RepID=UPI0033EB36DD